MSDPNYPGNVPPERPSAYPGGGQPPAVPPGGGYPGGGYPGGQIPPGGQVPPSGPPPSNPNDTRLTVAAGRFWAGAAATALVAALIGVVAVIIFERIFDIALITPPDFFSTDSDQSTYAFAAALIALLAAGVLHLLIVSTPRPRNFFGWIMALVTVVIAVLPFAWSSDVATAAFSGLVNLIIGIAIWSLLAGVASWTIVRRPPAA